MRLSSALPLHSRFVYRSPTTPDMPKHNWFRLFPVRSPLLRESLLFSFPPGTKMFQFPGFAPCITRYPVARVGSPIRMSTDQFVFANPRGLSQLITSFFASKSQGIPRTPFFNFLSPFLRISPLLRASFTYYSVCFLSSMSKNFFPSLKGIADLKGIEPSQLLEPTRQTLPYN